MKIDGNQIKVGNILEINSKLWRVLKTQHTQPGKGGAYLQVEMKEIREGTKMNERFRSSESVERAILDEKMCQYLYSESNKFMFMDNTTYEQIEIGDDIISAEQSKFFIENDNINLQFYEGSVVGLELPESVKLKVEETEAEEKSEDLTIEEILSVRGVTEKIADPVQQLAMLQQLISVGKLELYFNLDIDGGVYEDVLKIDGGEIKDNVRAYRSLAQDSVHRSMVRSQYDD